MGSLHPITIVLILANVLCSLRGFKDYNFREKYMFKVGAIKRGEHIRNISSGFLHADMGHLFFNMLTLYFFAPWVILGFGNNALKFLCVYIVSLLLGNFLSLMMHKNEPNYSALGASGAVTGVLYAAITIFPMLRINFIIPGFVFGIGYLIYSIYGMKKRIGNIGHSAHFGGAVGGYVTTLLIKPELFEMHPILLGLLALPIIALFVMDRMGKI
jgi:membrane associated rhomboid family serine protease